MEIAWDKKNRHINDCHVHVINNGGAKKNPNYVSSTYFWHWDKSFIRYPTSISFAFFPSKSQPQGMGATEFMNAYIIYESLEEEVKQKIEKLAVIHSYDIMSNLRRQNYEKASLKFKKGNEKFPEIIHPLVGVHPSTGKRTLNVDELSQGQIIGMGESESIEFRKKLLEHALMQQGASYCHNWETGDFVIWDNLALVHRGTPSDPLVSRILHRTNISSRSDFEGSCFLIASDLDNVHLADISTKLFTKPLILDSNAYDDLLSLEADVRLLRSGCEIQNIRPHAIVILKGEK